MEKKIIERLITVDSEIGKITRTKVLDDFDSKVKELKKKAQVELKEEDVFDRYFEDIEKVNNQTYLPLLYFVLFASAIKEEVYYKPFDKTMLKSLDKNVYSKLMDTVSFINSMVSIKETKENIYSFIIKE